MALEIDWEVWGLIPEERESDGAETSERFAALEASGNVHHHVAYLDGEPVGFGRGVVMTRRRRADGRRHATARRAAGASTLARARAAGSTPSSAARRCSSCRPAPMSAPILDGLGFVRHGRPRPLQRIRE